MQESKHIFVEAIDFSDRSNWRSTKVLLSIIGAWPFQSSTNRLVLTSVTSIMVWSMFIPEILKVITVCKNMDEISACLPHISLHVTAIIIILNLFSNSRVIEILLLRIRRDWQSDMLESEKAILQNDQKDHEKILNFYMFYISFVTALFVIMPSLPIIFYQIKPLNESRPRVIVYHTEFFIDEEKYDVPLFIHAFVTTPFPSTALLAFDTMFATSILHACSIFKIIGNRTQFLINNIEGQGPSKSHLIVQNETHKTLVECIRMHKDVLQFVDLLQSAFSTSLFIMNVISMMNLSMTGYQAMNHLNNPGEIGTLIPYVAAQLIRLYFRCWFGQKLINSSELFFDSVYQGNWYDLPFRSRRFIILILARGSKRSKITAGKIVDMSVGNFTFIHGHSGVFLQYVIRITLTCIIILEGCQDCYIIFHCLAINAIIYQTHAYCCIFGTINCSSRDTNIGLYSMDFIFYCLIYGYRSTACINQSTWCDTACQVKELFILILMRGSKELQMTAGCVFILSMDHLLNVIRTCLSYTVVLRSM